MGYIPILDGAGATQYLNVSGSGSTTAPFIPAHTVASPVDVNLLAGTNNVGDVDVLSVVGDNADLDSGVGSDVHAVVAWGLPASGGHVIGGTPTNPIRIDPVASTVQTVKIASWFPGADVVASVVGNVSAVGSMNVGNFPALQAVSVASFNVQLTASVNVGNFPAVQPVSIASNYINSVVTSSVIGTLYAVVNTGAAGTQNVFVSGSVNIIGNVLASIPDVARVSIQSMYVGANVVASVIGNPAVIASVAGFPSVTASIPNIVSITVQSIYAPMNVVASVIGALANHGVVASVAGTVNTAIAGIVPAGSAYLGNPTPNGALAASAEPVVVPTNAIVRMLADLTGALIVKPYSIPDNIVQGALKGTGATAAQALVNAAGSGMRIYITSWQLINSNASLVTDVCLHDGAATLAVGFALAGGGFAFQYPTPIRAAANGTLSIIAATASVLFLTNVNGFKGY